MAWTKRPTMPASKTTRPGGEEPPALVSGVRAAEEAGGSAPSLTPLPQPAGALLRLLEAAAVAARPGWPHRSAMTHC